MNRELDKQVAEQVMGLDLSIAPEHDWLRTSDGEIDMMGMDADTHNGPACQRCGYGFCIHCEGDAGYTAEPCQRSIPNYSGSIMLAWAVVERVQQLHPGWRFGLLGGDTTSIFYVFGKPRGGFFGWRAEFFGHEDAEQDTGQRHGEAIADTAPLAICLAALRALARPAAQETNEGGNQ